MATCLIKLKKGSTLYNAEIAGDAQTATREGILAWVAQEFGNSFRVSKVLSKGSVLKSHDAVKAGTMVLVLGSEVVGVSSQGRSIPAFLEIYEVISGVFSFLPLSVVRARCMAACRTWRDLAEVATRAHPNRYDVQNGNIVDLFRRQMLELPATLTPHSICKSTAYAKHLYVMTVERSTKVKKPERAVIPTTIIADSDSGSDSGSAAMEVDSDEDSDTDSSASGHEDPMAADAGMKVELGFVGENPANHALDHYLGRRDYGDAFGIRSFRTACEELVKSQGTWTLRCIDLRNRKELWARTRGELFPDETLCMPYTQLVASSRGVVLVQPHVIILVEHTSGRKIRVLSRQPGWEHFYGADLFCSSSHDGALSSPRSFAHFIVVQGNELLFLDHTLRTYEASVTLPFVAKTVVAFNREEQMLLVQAVSGDYVGMSLRDRMSPAVLWRMRPSGAEDGDDDGAPAASNQFAMLVSGDTDKGLSLRGNNPCLVAFSGTNVLFTNKERGILQDTEDRHFKMLIQSKCLALLESPEGFAEGVFVQNRIEIFTDFAQKGFANDESWAECAMTETRATHPHATNTGIFPSIPEWGEMEELQRSAPPRRFLDSTQDFNSAHNIQARKYSAFIKHYEKAIQELKARYWHTSAHSVIAFDAITREQTPVAGGVNEKMYDVKRGVVSLWQVHVPFPHNCLSSSLKKGNLLFIAMLHESTVGVYAIAVDRGFVRWRHLWRQNNIRGITLRALDGIVALELSTHTDERYVTVYEAVSGTLHHASVIE
eukprot:Rhum_TRINITY_DN2339_c0_g2::Rhum_TRINITY_DN2339_c0_g2_i1::g.6783::m.6783